MEQHIPVEIERVLKLEGALAPHTSTPIPVYAHISKTVIDNSFETKYVLLAPFPRGGEMGLGNINPKTKVLEPYGICAGGLALYERARNRVVSRVLVLPEAFEKLETLEDILGIQGISIKKEYVPGELV